MTAARFVIHGRVQGVGYRPFVYRLAHALGLTGNVRNRAGSVEILARGPAETLERFADALIHEAPTIARPCLSEHTALDDEMVSAESFQILPSQANSRANVHVPPDYHTCPDCLGELRDPDNRRHRYPFINCTQCGPRYTIIRSMPYDRATTTMAEFRLCTDCRREYHDPLDRRFHAEPIACPICGPQLAFCRNAETLKGNETALAATVAALQAGDIVAVRGVGGYHLMCDARNDDAVERLRQRKGRPDKPLAVLFAEDGVDLAATAELTERHETSLRAPERPIVLVPLKSSHGLAAGIAPGLSEVGAMLPYSPLHHLLVDDFGGPLVATSANLSGEPVLTEPNEAAGRLHGIADAFLHHNRPIERPVDDSVVRLIDSHPHPMRLGRGLAPLERRLPLQLPEPILAVGGHMKNTVALAWEDRVVVSPHLGEMDSPRSLALFERTVRDLQDLYGVTATRLVCDAHPDYATSRWARRMADDRELALTPVWHHHAHASAVVGEYQQQQSAAADAPPWLVFTWDGVGLGSDGTLWGGETLLGHPGQWRRISRLRPFRLPGGNRAGREPWRSAAGLCWTADVEWPDNQVDPRLAAKADLARQAWQTGLNCHETSAAGRLFDGAASLLGLGTHASFEGQGPMHLEALADQMAVRISPSELPLVDDPASTDSHPLTQLDWTPLLAMLRDSRHTPATRAACFHDSLARAVLQQAERARERHGTIGVALSGGVFQNTRLTGRILADLAHAGFETAFGEQIPCNDAGLSFGQIIEVAAQRKGPTTSRTRADTSQPAPTPQEG